MTSASISSSSRTPRSATHRRTDFTRWRSIRADLGFWTVVGGFVAAFSGPLGNWWNVPRAELLIGGLAFLVAGVVLLFGLNRIRPDVARAGAGFRRFQPSAGANHVGGWQLLGWLPLSAAGNWALAGAGDVALVLGIWQLTALRRSRRTEQRGGSVSAANHGRCGERLICRAEPASGPRREAMPAMGQNDRHPSWRIAPVSVPASSS